MDPIKTSSHMNVGQGNAIRYDQLVNFTKPKYPIAVSIDPKDGIMYLLSEAALKTPENLKLSSKILSTAADLLEGKSIKSENREYKKTAKKMVEFYTKQGKELHAKKLSVEEKKALANDLRSISNIQMAAESRQGSKDTDVKLLEFANKYGIFTSEVISKNFEQRGIPSDGQDFIRHVNAGIVDIVVDGVNINRTAGINTMDLSEVKDDNAKLKICTDRFELILDVFATKATSGVPQREQAKLKAEIRDLLDEMRREDTSDKATDCFEKRLDNIWKTSNEPAMIAMCRLIHLLNQTFTASVGKMTNYHTKDLRRVDCPYALLNLKDFQLDVVKENPKKIDIEFTGNQVKAKHVCKFANIAGGGLTVDQTVDLSSSLDALDKWEFKQTNLIKVPKNEKTDNATKIHHYWKLCGIASKLKM